MEKRKRKTLADRHTETMEFEKKLYQRWKEAIDLLELLINSSAEIGEEIKSQLAEGKKLIFNPKHVALIKIHVRAVQVAREILTLLKSGYADGANGRWRTLFELTATFLLLKNNTDNLSQRFLEYRIVKDYKDVNLLEDYYSRLGYRSIPRKSIQSIKNEYGKLKNKYGSHTIKRDLGWIPSGILSDCNFRGLTKNVGIDHYLPYYYLSLDAAHAGSKGFYRIGLMKNDQNKVLLTGSSDYGLADPIQNTAYCLKLIDTAFLSLDSNSENVIRMKLLAKFFEKIGEIAVKIQKNVEIENKP